MMMLGITGGIAEGKSTVARRFAALGVPVSESDRVVHRLLGKGGAAVERVASLCPEALVSGVIDRKTLGNIVFADRKKLQELEAILHPLVVREEARFAARMRRRRAGMILLVIPLLFETRAERRLCGTIAVVAPPFLKKARALSRPGMSGKKLEGILARQMPGHRQRLRADFVVHTGLGMAHSARQIKAILVRLRRGRR